MQLKVQATGEHSIVIVFVHLQCKPILRLICPSQYKHCVKMGVRFFSVCAFNLATSQMGLVGSM